MHLSFLARARAAAGDATAAVAAAREAVGIGPGYAPGWFVLALALALEGSVGDAGKAIGRCEALMPGLATGRAGWRPYDAGATNRRLQAAIAVALAAARRD